MKKTDLAMLILIAAAGVTIAFFITNAIIGDQVSEPVTVKSIEEISATVEEPDPTIFNSNAINPAVEVQIEEGQ